MTIPRAVCTEAMLSGPALHSLLELTASSNRLSTLSKSAAERSTRSGFMKYLRKVLPEVNL
jgi:hypothetical protein